MVEKKQNQFFAVKNIMLTTHYHGDYCGRFGANELNFTLLLYGTMRPLNMTLLLLRLTHIMREYKMPVMSLTLFGVSLVIR